jgi:aspartoacylase
VDQINRLAIVGGIHGNELIGVYLVKKFQQNPELINRPSLETLTLLGNPQAIAQGRRYIDKDLNRCFYTESLPDAELESYEDLRAQEIQHLLQPRMDAIIDLHTTTTNMGLSLILSNTHPTLLRLAAYLSSINPLVKVSGHQQSKESGFLRSLCELGLVIEVGAVAQNVLNAELFQHTEQLVYGILDYFEWYNQGKTVPTNEVLTFYEYMGVIDYPRDEVGEILAMVHPRLQFQDYQPLNPGDPLFLTFAGEEIFYEGNSTVYPVFINEAAYYEKGIAMHLTKKQLIQDY